MAGTPEPVRSATELKRHWRSVRDLNQSLNQNPSTVVREQTILRHLKLIAFAYEERGLRDRVRDRETPGTCRDRAGTAGNSDLP